MSRIKNLNKKKKITRKNKRKSHKFTRRKKGGSPDAGFEKVDKAEIYIGKKEGDDDAEGKFEVERNMLNEVWRTKHKDLIVKQVSKKEGSDPYFQVYNKDKKSEEKDYKLMVKIGDNYHSISEDSDYKIKNGNDNVLGVYKKPEKKSETPVKEDGNNDTETLKDKIKSKQGKKEISSKGDVCDQIIRFLQPNGTFDQLLKDEEISKRFSNDTQKEKAWRVYFAEFLEGLKQAGTVNTDDGVLNKLTADFGEWGKIKKDIEETQKNASLLDKKLTDGRGKAVLDKTVNFVQGVTARVQRRINPLSGGSLEQSTLSLDNSQDLNKLYLQELEQVSDKSSEERENLETIKDILTPHNPENNFHLSVFKEFRKNLVSSDDQHLALLLDTLTDPNLNTNYSLSNKYGQDLRGGAPEGGEQQQQNEQDDDQWNPHQQKRDESHTDRLDWYSDSDEDDDQWNSSQQREETPPTEELDVFRGVKQRVTSLFKHKWRDLPKGNLKNFLEKDKLKMKIFSYPLSLKQLHAMFYLYNEPGEYTQEVIYDNINSLNIIPNGKGVVTPLFKSENFIREMVEDMFNTNIDEARLRDNEQFTNEKMSNYLKKLKEQHGDTPGIIVNNVLKYLDDNNHEKYLSFLELITRYQYYEPLRKSDDGKHYTKRQFKNFFGVPTVWNDSDEQKNREDHGVVIGEEIKSLLFFQNNSPNILFSSDFDNKNGLMVYFDNSKYFLAKLSIEGQNEYTDTYEPTKKNNTNTNTNTNIYNSISSLYQYTKKKYMSEEQLREEEIERTVNFFLSFENDFEKLVLYFIDKPEENLDNYLKEEQNSVLKNLQNKDDIDIINKSIDQHITEVNKGIASAGGSSGDSGNGGANVSVNIGTDGSGNGGTDGSSPDGGPADGFIFLSKSQLEPRFELYRKKLEILNKIQNCLTDINDKATRRSFFDRVSNLFNKYGPVNNLIELRKEFRQTQQELSQIENKTEEIILLRILLNKQLDILVYFKDHKNHFEIQLYEIKRQFLSNTPQLKQFEDMNHLTPLPLTSEKESLLAKIFDELHAEFMSPGSIQEIEKKLAELDSQEAIQQITLPASKSGIGAATSKIMSFIYVVTKLYFLRFGLGFAKIFLSWRIFLPLLFLLITGLIPKDNLQGIKKALVSFLKILCYASSRVLNSVYNFFSTGKEEDSQPSSKVTNRLSRGNEDLSHVSSSQSSYSSENYSNQPANKPSVIRTKEKGVYFLRKRNQKKEKRKKDRKLNNEE